MSRSVFRVPGKHGYSVKYSPFFPNQLVYVANENFGITGRGALYYLEVAPNNSVYQQTSFEWKDGLFDVAWSELNPGVCVTASGDGSLQIWSILNSQGPLQVLKEHTKEVYSVDWCLIRGDDKFASASWDGTVKVWTADRPSSVCSFPGHQNVVYCVSWSPHIPGCLASASGDKTLRIWNMRSPGPTLAVPAHSAEILSCDWSKYNPNLLVTAATDGLARGWDLRNPRQCTFQLQGHQYAIKKVKFSPHRESILATVSYDFTTRIWDHKSSTNAIEVLQNHTEFVYGVDFNLHVEGELADCSFDQLLCICKPSSIQHMQSTP